MTFTFDKSSKKRENAQTLFIFYPRMDLPKNILYAGET